MTETRTAEGSGPTVRRQRRGDTSTSPAATPSPSDGGATATVAVDLPNLGPGAAHTSVGAPFAKGKPWKAEDLRRLRELREAGKSRAECAREMGRTETAVARAIERHRIIIRAWRLWTTTELRTLLRMRMDGHTLREIAPLVDHPVSCVEAKWKQIARRLPIETVEALTTSAAERRRAAHQAWVEKQRVPVPGGGRNPLYRKLLRSGVPRDVAIAECLK